MSQCNLDLTSHFGVLLDDFRELTSHLSELLALLIDIAFFSEPLHTKNKLCAPPKNSSTGLYCWNNITYKLT